MTTNNRIINKEQFYTRPQTAQRLSEWINKNLIFKKVIEPSAGEGVWLKHFNNPIAYDIEPKGEGIIKANFLELQLPYDKDTIIVGNPPFGRRGNLAIKFVNKAAQIGSQIAMILPPSFAKRSTHKMINPYLHLDYQEPLLDEIFTGERGEHKVKSVFQVWSLREHKRKITQDLRGCKDFHFVKDPLQAHIAIRTHGAGVGTIFTNSLDSLTPTTTALIRITHPQPHIIIDKLANLNYWEWAQWGIVPVISPTEIIWIYESVSGKG